MRYSWCFNRMRPTDKAREPIVGEFFATEAIDNPGEALVREGIQNSLDARRNGTKVRIRLFISGNARSLPYHTVAPYLSGLSDHLKAPGNGLQNIPNDNAHCSILIFEDFGTTGLLGDPAEWRPPSGSGNHFYHFYRAEGRSDKGEKHIGRWGVGKQVFPRASQINAVLGLTVRSDEGDRLLMGMSVLKSHDVAGIRYAPDGLLGEAPKVHEEKPILPIKDPVYIDAFCNSFGILRKDEPGLSIVVPWCDPDLSEEDLIRAVLRGYFWPILRGDLEVEIDSGANPTILDSDNVEGAIKGIGGEIENEMMPLIQLAKWAREAPISATISTLMPDTTKGWQWSKDLFSQEALDKLKTLYFHGDNIALRVPVTIREKDKPQRASHFDVFIHRDGTEHPGRPVFIREGILIPDVRAPATRGVRAIVNVEAGPLAVFLGDSEGPAHTQWQKNSDNFQGKYVSGPKDLTFVIRSVAEIINIVCEQDVQVDRTLLLDLFYLPGSTEDSETRRSDDLSANYGEGPDRPRVPPIHGKKVFRIDRIDGGFLVRGTNRDGSDPHGKVVIRSAYQVRRGDPFGKYDPSDFNLSHDIELTITGASVVHKEGNVLILTIEDPDFRVEVKGFDRKRDLRVEVRHQGEEHVG